MTIHARGLTFDAYEVSPPDADAGQAAGAAGGPAPVILLHGWPGFASTWRQAAMTLARVGRRVLAYDMRGVSNGARPDDIDGYTGDSLAKDLIAIADAHGFERFHLMAHGWGAWTGWHAVAASPDRIVSFSALGAPHPYALFTAAAMSNQQDQLLSPMRRARRHTAEAHTALLDNDAELLRDLYDGRIDSSTVEEDIARYRDNDTLASSMRLHESLNVMDLDDELLCTVPTAYFWGSEDRYFTRLAFGLTGDYVKADYKPTEVAGASQWVGIDAHAFVMKTTAEWFSAHDD